MAEGAYGLFPRTLHFLVGLDTTTGISSSEDDPEPPIGSRIFATSTRGSLAPGSLEEASRHGPSSTIAVEVVPLQPRPL